MTPRQSDTKLTVSPFLFDSLGSTIPSSSRKVHIRRLVDVLQLSIHRGDWPRAQRAWCILVRCKEFDWKDMWRTGLLLAGFVDSAADLGMEGRPQRLEYLRVMMLRSPERRIPILQEIVLHLVITDRHQDALDEIELYLPSFPYQDDPVLHIYAGLLRLSLALATRNLLDNSNQHGDPLSTSLHSISQSDVRECESHFRRALDIDPGNPVALEFIEILVKSPPEDIDDDKDEAEDRDEFESYSREDVKDKRPHKKRRAYD